MQLINFTNAAWTDVTYPNLQKKTKLHIARKKDAEQIPANTTSDNGMRASMHKSPCMPDQMSSTTTSKSIYALKTAELSSGFALAV